jgi:hypothetical protein
MTTKVRIEIVQEHMPVEVDVVDSRGIVQRTLVLRAGDNAEEYVHSGVMLRVREIDTFKEQPHADAR